MEIKIVEPVPTSEIAEDQDKSTVHFSHIMQSSERNVTLPRSGVYDRSAKSSKAEWSLNDCLETGTNYIPLIFNTLVNILTAVGSSVIERAFLVVGLKKEILRCSVSFGVKTLLISTPK